MCIRDRGGSTPTSVGDNGLDGETDLGVDGGGGGGGGGAGKVLLRARMVGGLSNASVVVTPTPTVL